MNDGRVRCPAVLVAAPASGQGKTTVAAAMARLHGRAGRRVRAFKCGPDFLDPFWLATASGAPVDALDLWMTGEADCAARLRAAAADADLLVVEGAMGLFDGTPSAADIAARFELPVLAVIDAQAMAGTFGALAFGLKHYRPELPWAGVLANRVATERHAGMLQAGLRDAGDWLGALPRGAAWALPERHLGLVADLPQADALARLDAAADALAATPLGRLDSAGLQRWSVDFGAADTAPVTALPPLLRGRRIAVARDAAFCFLYGANLDCLRSLGAETVFFSPLADAPLPDCDAVWLPGGYPELHLPALAAARTTRAGLAAHIAAGRPVWAECGGMMALMDTIVDAAGAAHRAWGLLPGTVTMQRRLAALGPQRLELPAGTLRGHTFHYSTADTPLAAVARTARPEAPVAADAGEALYRQGPVQASYFHAWFPSSPQATAALFGGAP
ncbi:cobyrinate a,c-diamide synthase [uncultured Xylophilus sp.]|uniref:cobyrinate a,c-diamide synthase n=1 Tax=uncultured Xylophilus sp. TaxID=296832 RepID=UPI0025DAF21B|nr:cobyrinate a,c-diamide synthase [uncultured Xylophilus sp.]